MNTKILKRALEIASKFIDSRVLGLCDDCPADTGFMLKGCERKYSNIQCKTHIRNHFIRKATAEIKAKG